MFLFVDGQPVVLRFNQVEQRYYAAFVDQFPEAEVSMSQWRGSYEYQTLYPAMQQMVENGALTLDALNEVLGTIAAANESIRRPAVLYSRVAERFKELGYEATSRVATLETRGIVAICVDQEREPRTMTIGASTTDPDDAGFAGYMGEMTNTDFRGEKIIDLSTVSQIESGFVYLIFNAMPADTGDITAVFGGAFNHTATFTLVPGSASWNVDDPALASLIRGSVGLKVTVILDGDTGSTPVNDDDDEIGNLIRDEMLPVGQHMEGDIIYQTALSNGQPIDIKWTVPVVGGHLYRVTITRARGSQYPADSVDQIIEKFQENFESIMGIGKDITPQRYLTVRDLPWATSVLVEWSDVDVWRTDDQEVPFNHKYGADLPPANVVIV